MYVRELKQKDFDIFYTMLIKCMTEKGIVDQTFNREAMNIEAKACLIRADHIVLGLFVDDEIQGFAIAMLGKNGYNDDIFCKIDLIHTSVAHRDDIYLQELFAKIHEVAKEQNCKNLFLSKSSTNLDDKQFKLMADHNNFFKSDEILKANI